MRPQHRFYLSTARLLPSLLCSRRCCDRVELAFNAVSLPARTSAARENARAARHARARILLLSAAATRLSAYTLRLFSHLRSTPSPRRDALLAATASPSHAACHRYLLSYTLLDLVLFAPTLYLLAAPSSPYDAGAAHAIGAAFNT